MEEAVANVTCASEEVVVGRSERQRRGNGGQVPKISSPEGQTRDVLVGYARLYVPKAK